MSDARDTNESKVRAASPAREEALVAFVEDAGWGAATRSHLAGDASHRRYERLTAADGTIVVLMDDPSDPLDTPVSADQRSYGQIAHLASDCRPFAAVGNQLRREGLAAPELFAADLAQGFMILEDLGDHVFGPEIQGAADPAAREADLYGRAVDVLVHHHDQHPGAEALAALALPGGGSYAVPPYDAEAMQIEADLLLDWYAPARLGKSLDEEARVSFRAIWAALFPLAAARDPVLVLRDYHSPNLLDLPQRAGVQSIGLIDYQDAVLGHPAYDLMSLLQDARRDVPEGLEKDLMDRYLHARPGEDEASFRTAYAVLGAQRASKIIGIFLRLWKRDGKDTYLVHLPRMWRYLERNLAHPALAGYRDWIDTHFPKESRDR